MDSTSTLSADAKEALDEGALLVTGTNRLARTLRHEYNRIKEEGRETVWASPKIASLGTWLRTLWQDELCFSREVGHDAVLLSRVHEEAVWERVIRAWCQQNERTIMQLPAAAESARTAYALLHNWHLPSPTLAEHPNDDVRAFISWKEEFESWCEGKGRMSSALLPKEVAVAFRDKAVLAPSVLYLAGFEEESPAQHFLLEAIRETGAEIAHLLPPKRGGNVLVATCDSPEDEIEACAQWIRRHLKTNPERTIGVVVPDLAKRRSCIARTFEDMLTPGSVLPGAPPQRHVNFSLGQPFSEYPLIATALNALNLLRGEIELNNLGSLLRSPFLGEGNAEAHARALLDVQLRDIGERNVRLPWLIEQAGSRAIGKSRHSPKLESRLEQLQASIEAFPSKAGAARWARVFEEAVAVLGWPGERTLNSSEYQARQKWRDLLDTFAGFEAILDPLALRDALARLNRLAAGTTFQPETDDAPVQVMGFLEAAGAQFDALWVMNLTDSQLPGSPHPHPLLPLYLQREYELPHSSPNNEMMFAKHRLDGLIRAAPEVTLSHARIEEDRENVPSPLLRPYADQSFDPPPIETQSYTESIRKSAELEFIDDYKAPALAPDQRATGGAGVLTSHAACPFQAFGTYRLHAKKLEEAQDGLEARTRGTLVHEVLQELWKQLGDQTALLEMDGKSLSDLINQVIDDTVERYKDKRPTTFKPTFTALQKQALNRIVEGWMAKERNRSAFQVLDTERELVDQQVGKLTIGRLFVDRIDVLQDGSRVIVDYKTGRRGKKRGAWKGARPDDPQLPLYATLAEGDISGVAFANVKPDEPDWSGLSRDGDVFENQPAYPQGRAMTGWEDMYPDWESLLKTWRQDLENLANDYVGGNARVDPKVPGKTCTYCHLTAACRITELSERAGRIFVESADGPEDE